MKILYTTDLHGSDTYYTAINKKAVKHKVDVVINGADMLPFKEPVPEGQKKYIRLLEKRYFPFYEKRKIHYLCCLGNDDARIHDQMFDEVCSKFTYVHNIAQRKIKIDGFEFIGFNLVTDYPFGIKDRCRMDTKDFIFPDQLGKGFLSTDNGWEELDDWFSIARTLPTIKDELESLPQPSDMSKTIYSIHMPPKGFGLDILLNERQVGSKAVYNFLEEKQPLLSLHGHIHESFKMSGIWKAQLKNTICIQPGQDGFEPTYVIIDTETMKMKRYGHDSELMMINGYVENDKIKYAKISELPDYLIKLFQEWNQNQSIENSSEQENGLFFDANDFENFCSSQNIKIKLIRTEI